MNDHRGGVPGRASRLVATLVVLAACSDGTAPQLEDPLPTPYQVSPRGVRVNGVTRVLVIPTRLAGGAAPSITPQQLRYEMFGGRDDGLVSRVYGLASGGRFALRGDVAPWVQTTVARNMLNIDTLAAQAIRLVDAHVDFTRYDSDGPDGIPNSGDDDGVVDGGIAIMIPELDMGCPGPGIHPFARLGWGIGTGAERTPFPTGDIGAGGTPIGITGFTIMSARDCSDTRANAAPLAHEFGHLLFGLPDLYHQADVTVPANERWKGRRWVVGCWELMAAGSGWGCGAGAPPSVRLNSTFGAWTRLEIGWATPTVISPDVDATYELRALDRAGGGTVLSLPISDGERFLVEYRQQMAGDVGIPADGVLIYHVVDSLPFWIDPAGPRRYRVMLMEADDDDALVRTWSEGGNRGVAFDAFGAAVRTFSSATHTGARLADGSMLPFTIDEISFDRSAGQAWTRIRPGAATRVVRASDACVPPRTCLVSQARVSAP